MTKLTESLEKQIWREFVFLMVAISYGACNYLPVQAQAVSADERGKEAAYINQLIRDNPSKALDYLHEKLARDPDDSYLLTTTGGLELELEQTKNSAKRFERYFVLNPKSQNANAYMCLANDYRLMGNVDKTLSLYNIAIANIPKNANLFCERGCVYAFLKQPDKGIADLNKAVALEPKNAHYIFERGKIYAQSQKYTEAINDFSSVIKMGSPNVRVYSLRAEMYKKINRNDLAQKDLEQVNKFSMDMLNLK